METDGQTLEDVPGRDGITEIDHNDDSVATRVCIHNYMSFIEWAASRDGHYYVDVCGFSHSTGTFSFKIAETDNGAFRSSFQIISPAPG
jgi:hypothetical protein